MITGLTLQLYDGIYTAIKHVLEYDIGTPHTGLKDRSLHFWQRTWSHPEPPVSTPCSWALLHH